MIERLAEALHKSDCRALGLGLHDANEVGQWCNVLPPVLLAALRAEGVYLVTAETLAKVLPHMTDDNPLPFGTQLGGHSYDDWAKWYRAAAAAILAALPEETP